MMTKLAAVRRLKEQLETVADDWPATDMEVQRSLAGLSILRVIAFMQDLGWENDGLIDPFYSLAASLDALNDGNQVPLLTAQSKGGRPPLPARIQQIRGQVVAVQESLIGLGYTKGRAAEIVFRALGTEAVEVLSGPTRNVASAAWISKWREACGEAERDAPIRRGFRSETELIDRSGLLASPENAMRDAKTLLRITRKEALETRMLRKSE